ncbi:hypothetical protein BDZ94DRAFT_409109 [Collybia nuda]|uniref:DUF6534 domain-containing protein n=1 Tax=Collybia nuda TaxID=64659 RepID=A0A9P6CGD8_9AGAR|nr:hypothetical protein BDZ94DRAFT_409109 [Collybia nuda]
MAANPFLLAVGPVYLGVIFNWGLLGAFLVQIYIYTVWYHQTDRGAVRYIVYGLLCIEGLQTGLMTHTGWEILAFHWGDPSVLLNIPWSSATTPIICGTVAMIVQLYFCWRIWLLGANKIFARVVGAVCAALAVIQCIAAITYGAKFIALDLNAAFFETTEAKAIAIVWLVCTAVCDVLITMSLVYIFTIAKSRSLAHTGSLLNRLIIQTIQSGVITAIFAILHLAFFLAYPDSLLNIPFVYVLSKLFVPVLSTNPSTYTLFYRYPNVLLANLNNRNRLNQRGTVVSEGISLPGDSHTLRSTLPTVPSSSGPGTKIGLFPSNGGIEMTISTHRSNGRDDDSRKGHSLSNV